MRKTSITIVALVVLSVLALTLRGYKAFLGHAQGRLPVSSAMLPLGTQAPDFDLPDVASGHRVSLKTFQDREALLVMFICQHCPYVQHVKAQLAQLAKDYAGRNLGIVAISANDPQAYPVDAPEQLRLFAQKEGFSFPLCFNESQKTAKDYTAACTPDFFVFDRKRLLVYRGQLDDSRPGNDRPATGRDLRAALDAVLAGKPVSPEQKPSTGCSIKWKPGNAPAFR